MSTYSHSIEIDANAETVWGQLTDFGSYGDWHPLFASFEGEAAIGSDLKVQLRGPRGRGSGTFRTVEPNAKLGWDGGGMMGLFRVKSDFSIEPAGDSSVKLTWVQQFGGPMSILLSPMLKKDGSVRDETLQKLKERSEGAAT